MKEIHKNNILLIRKLSDLMKNQGINSLNYKCDDVKFKILFNQADSTVINKKNDNFIKDKKESEIATKFNEEKNLENHPGAVKSPMVGTAYTSPDPNSKPFIKIGDKVSIGQPLVIIEAMKVMNTINADKNGEIIFIGFQNGEPVEYDQLLVIIG